MVLYLAVKKLGFFRQDVRLRPEVEMMLAVDVLHAVNSIRKEVFSCQLNAPGEVINFLVLRHALIEAVLQGLCGPHDEPVVSDRLRLVW